MMAPVHNLRILDQDGDELWIGKDVNRHFEEPMLLLRVTQEVDTCSVNVNRERALRIIAALSKWVEEITD